MDEKKLKVSEFSALTVRIKKKKKHFTEQLIQLNFKKVIHACVCMFTMIFFLL